MKQKLYDLNAERYMLSGIITGDTEGLDLLSENDFTTESHKAIFRIAKEFYTSNTSPDILLVASAMNAKGLDSAKVLEPIVACEYLQNNRQKHIEILKTYTAKRQAIQALHEMTSDLEDDNTNSPEKVQTILEKAASLNIELTNTDNDKLKEIALKTYEDILSHYVGDTELLPTGILDLDRMIGGMGPGEVYIIGARPGIGKTALAIQISMNLASKNNPVAIISREMNETEICKRMISNYDSIPANRIRSAKYLSEIDLDRISNTCTRLSRLPVFINSRLSRVEDIKAYATKLKKSYSLKCLIVDYLQLCTTMEKLQSREQVVAYVIRTFKEVAMSLRIPVIVLSQLSRASTKENREPNLSDLRESGEIEQAADCVMFLHVNKKEEWEDENNLPLKIIVAKQRAGRTGTFELMFVKEFMQIRNIVGEEIAGYEEQAKWMDK